MLDKLVVKLMILKMRLSDERGQDLMEYALITGGIAVVVLVGIGLFATGMSDWFSGLADWISTELSP